MKLPLIPNAIDRLVPKSIENFGAIAPFSGAYARLDGHFIWTPKVREMKVPAISQNKITDSLKNAIIKSGLSDGMTISFHHHFRNGDRLLPQVLSIIDELGIKGLTLAPSSLTDAHACVANAIRKGTITRLYTSGVRGEDLVLLGSREPGVQRQDFGIG